MCAARVTTLRHVSDDVGERDYNHCIITSSLLGGGGNGTVLGYGIIVANVVGCCLSVNCYCRYTIRKLNKL